MVCVHLASRQEICYTYALVNLYICILQIYIDLVNLHGYDRHVSRLEKNMAWTHDMQNISATLHYTKHGWHVEFCIPFFVRRSHLSCLIGRQTAIFRGNSQLTHQPADRSISWCCSVSYHWGYLLISWGYNIILHQYTYCLIKLIATC